jgi:cytochrome-b5 reductase
MHRITRSCLSRSLTYSYLNHRAPRSISTSLLLPINTMDIEKSLHRSDDDGIINFSLTEKWPTSPDSYVLRFALPDEHPTLGRPAPSSVKLCMFDEAAGKTIEKSYSPVSHEDTQGFFDLLVKSYEPCPGGGFGNFLCHLEPGEAAPMKIKQARKINGIVGIKRRWSSLTMIGGGTGVAPFVQIIRSILEDEGDQTNLRLISVDKREEDILMKKEINELVAGHPDRLTVTYILTEPSEDWKGLTGRGSVEMARQLIPSPIDEEEGTSGDSYLPTETKQEGRARSMVMVCGRDGFVETWAGGLVRIPASPGVKKQKLQGPVGGFLGPLGYDELQVNKF